MIFRAGGLAAIAVLLCGCPVPIIKSGATVTAKTLPDKVPELVKYADDTIAKWIATPDGPPTDAENALLALDKAHTLDPKNFEAAWKAARVCTMLADDLYDDKTKRAHFSGRGVEYAKAAIELEPKRVEGYYFSGENIGLLATTKIVGGKFDVPKVRDAEKRAMQIDASFDHGGPPRVLGALYSEAPPWPASIGDPDKGVELLQQALRMAPEWPLNNLLYGNALLADEKFDEAKQQYLIVMRAEPRAEIAHFLPKWKKIARQKTEEAEKKKAAGAGA